MKAYQVDGFEYSVIIYAERNVNARREGALELNEEFSNVSCRRAPWADQFYGKDIPVDEYLKNDWRMECCSCGTLHREDDQYIIHNNRLFCNDECLSRFKED